MNKKLQDHNDTSDQGVPAARHAYDLLGPDQVLDAVESLGLVSNARIFALNSYENRVYQIGLEDGGFVIAKFYRPERWSDESILEEHAFSAELSDLEIPVVPPTVVDGKTLHHFQIEDQSFRFALFPRLGGRAPELDDPDNLQVLGRFLGRLHSVGSNGQFVHRKTLNVDDWAVVSRDYLLDKGFIPHSLREAYSSLSRDLIQAVSSIFADSRSMRQIRLHGDCHPGNVLWREDQPWFVDFDDA